MFLPFNFKNPPTGEVFKTLVTFVVLHFLQCHKTCCVQQIVDNVWVAERNVDKTTTAFIPGQYSTNLSAGKRDTYQQKTQLYYGPVMIAY